jgi:hypothetical protein
MTPMRPRAVRPTGEEGAHRFDIVEGLPPTRPRAAVEIRRGGQEAPRGQSVRLVAQVVAHAEDVVDDDHARPWSWALG